MMTFIFYLVTQNLYIVCVGSHFNCILGKQYFQTMAGAKGVPRSSGSTVRPKRQRNLCFFYSVKVFGTYQLLIGYKTSKDKVIPLSSSKDGASVKIPFGAPISCTYRTRITDSGDEVSEYRFRNARNQFASLKDSLLNNLDFSDSNFSRHVTRLVSTEKKIKLLALYVSMTNFFQDFVHHREGLHNSHGFLLEDEDKMRKEITEAGGSVQGLIEFVEMVKESALPVQSPTEAMDAIKQVYFKRRKRKLSTADGSIEKDIKRSWFERIELNEKKELEDEQGLEVRFQNSLNGVAHIPLDNISIPNQLNENIKLKGRERIEMIKASMLKRYNPSLTVMIVCPVIEGKADTNVDKFFVIQKVKCFKALKELDEQGVFANLAGHADRTVLCYVIDVNSPDIIQYSNMSENYVTGQFASKIQPHDILNHFFCISKLKNVDAVKVVSRMNRLCCFRSEESAALEKICSGWSVTGLDCLKQVLLEYESYQTLDVSKVTGLNAKIARCEPLKLSNVMLRLLGKCSEEYFVEHHAKILNRSIALKDLLENYQKNLELDKVYHVLEKLASFTPIKQIKSLHPKMFDEELMKTFIGAQYTEKVKNLRAVELEKYYNFVVTQKSGKHDYNHPVVLNESDSLKDVVNKKEEIIRNANLCILRFRNIELQLIDKLLKYIFENQMEFQSFLLFFCCEEDCFETLDYLRNHLNVSKRGPDFRVFPLYFEKSSKVVNDSKCCENMLHALLVGKFTVIKPPLLQLYNDVSQVMKVLYSICPQNSKVLMISDRDLELIKVHDGQFLWSTAYYGNALSLNKFRKMIEKDEQSLDLSKSVECSTASVSAIIKDENVASTSTTPSKPEQSRFSQYTTPQKIGSVKDKLLEYKYDHTASMLRSPAQMLKKCLDFYK